MIGVWTLRPQPSGGRRCGRAFIQARSGVGLLRVYRHGLEDVEDYQASEAAVTADYDAEAAVERELVLRLAGALWRSSPHDRHRGRPFRIRQPQRQAAIIRWSFAPKSRRGSRSPPNKTNCIRSRQGSLFRRRQASVVSVRKGIS